MTKFNKANFFVTEVVTYDGKFVARFKYNKSSRASFIKFLIANFTVEEYFDRMKNEAPLTILQSKGYLQPYIAKMLKNGGYPQTVDGYKQFISDMVAKTTKVHG